MRRVIKLTDESHPDTPPNVSTVTDESYPLVWQIYIDGVPFLGVPLTGKRYDRGPADEAERIQLKAIETGRYEFVDLRLRPDRRSAAERRAAATDAPRESRRAADSIGDFGFDRRNAAAHRLNRLETS